ncbi:hypothetical protein [Anaplasma capra]|uniref:hypothetical protein n=1 Tax=Anaplasma capra TaxID=1562740 RepID=UPI0021D5FB72|nr:hypothetical protein [Anaplasma capra]MCU7611958.1 hypothetical protein [Anaplasma capra]
MQRRPLEYVMELTAHIVFVVEKEVECIRLRDMRKFRELQNIEMVLLQLLEEARSKIRGNTHALLRDSDPSTLENLNLVFAKLDRCLAVKHDLISQSCHRVAEWLCQPHSDTLN